MEKDTAFKLREEQIEAAVLAIAERTEKIREHFIENNILEGLDYIGVDMLDIANTLTTQIENNLIRVYGENKIDKINNSLTEFIIPKIVEIAEDKDAGDGEMSPIDVAQMLVVAAMELLVIVKEVYCKKEGNENE